MENKICKLCKNAIADKTNSHILSHSLIKEAINYEGQNEREKEHSFSISPQNIEVYLGQSALTPDILEKIYNKELSYEEIDEIVTKNTPNPYARDYIFCSNCEDRLGKIEGYFKENIYRKLKEGKPISNKNNTNLVIRVFTYSLIWRISLVRFNDFQLDAKIEEKLRVILDNCLSKNTSEMLENLAKNKEDITAYPLILTFLEASPESDMTENVIWVDLYAKMPYFFIINNLAIQFYTKESHTRSTPRSFFGLTDLVKTKECVNFKEDNFKISVVNNENRLSILKEVFAFNAHLKIQKIVEIFRLLYKNIRRVEPTKEQEYLLLQRIIHDEKVNNEGKYSRIHILHHIANYLNEIKNKTV